MSEAEYAALIAEAHEYVDALQGGESANWVHLVQCVDMLADALTAALATTGGETEWEYRVLNQSFLGFRTHREDAERYSALVRAEHPGDAYRGRVEKRSHTWSEWVPVDPTSPETTERQS